MNNMGVGCGAAIGSITQAMSAQKVLATAAIPTTVIKYDSNTRGNKGCIYGLSFSCAQTDNVATVLGNEGIRVKQWNRG